MARYAVISSNTIANIIEWDGGSGWVPPSGTTVALAPMPCSVGWAWNNGNPVDPNPPPLAVELPPVELTITEKLAMVGLTLDELKTALDIK